MLTLTTGQYGARNEVLEALFNQLKPISSDFLLGEWDGGIFISAHPAGMALERINWAGKTFHSTEQVQPVIVHGEQPGERVWCKEYGLARVSVCTGTLMTIMLTSLRSAKSNFVVWYLLPWCTMTSQSLITFASWMSRLSWELWMSDQRLLVKFQSHLRCFTFT